MAYLKVENVRITGISAGVPKHAEGSVSTTDKYGAEDFVQTTGIKEKRYDERLTTSDLGLPAAEKLIADLGWDKKEIGALVFVSQTPDYILPATACILQAKLGLERSCMAMDINLGCSGWVYGSRENKEITRGDNSKVRKPRKEVRSHRCKHHQQNTRDRRENLRCKRYHRKH